jgi:hypothetical protein
LKPASPYHREVMHRRPVQRKHVHVVPSGLDDPDSRAMGWSPQRVANPCNEHAVLDEKDLYCALHGLFTRSR